MTTAQYSLEDIIQKQREEFEGFKTLPYVDREQEGKLREALGTSLIKVVMGPRRSGKSRLIQKVLEEQKIVYLNFEEESFQSIPADLLIDTAKKMYPNAIYWYLDEIQDFPHWETLLNKLHRRRHNLIVTGSNAKLLSSELATALTGRHIAIELFPFSYSEYLLAKNEPKNWTSFSSYLTTGGFPEVVLASPRLDPSAYLSTLFDSILLKDLVQRKRIKNPVQLTNTLSLLINNIASRTSARNLSKALGGSPSYTTVEKYLQFAAEAYLIENIHAFDNKTKVRLQSERKPYCIDSGFIEAKSQKIMPLMSKELENAIYLKLRRNGKVANSSLFYCRTKEGFEIDFLVREGHITTQLIQVALDISAIETKKRECRAFESAAIDHPKAELVLVTAHDSAEMPTAKGKKITVVPAYEFCGENRAWRESGRSYLA